MAGRRKGRHRGRNPRDANEGPAIEGAVRHGANLQIGRSSMVEWSSTNGRRIADELASDGISPSRDQENWYTPGFGITISGRSPKVGFAGTISWVDPMISSQVMVRPL